LAAAVGIVMALEMGLVLIYGRYFGGSSAAAPPDPAPAYSNTRELGRLLYTDYVYPFELAAVVLLVAIIAAIALTMRKRKDTKYQDPAQQIKVRRADRVRMVSMPSETRIETSDAILPANAAAGTAPGKPDAAG